MKRRRLLKITLWTAIAVLVAYVAWLLSGLVAALAMIAAMGGGGLGAVSYSLVELLLVPGACVSVAVWAGVMLRRERRNATSSEGANSSGAA